VEKIQGPVLLFSGDDDRLWPSTYMAEMVMNRLRQHAHLYRSQHYSYPGCGHVFPLPTMVPPPTRRAHRVTGELLDYGGTLEATAWAAWDSWSKVLQFLAKNLKN
jgi:acetyl esterase/lipase